MRRAGVGATRRTIQGKQAKLKACQDGTAEEMAVGDDPTSPKQRPFLPGGPLTLPLSPKRVPLADRIIELLPRLGFETKTREFFYVLTHVHDMNWCHGVRLLRRGLFLKGPHSGQPRWTVALPQDGMLELNAPGGRCVLAAAQLACKKHTPLHKRVWSLDESARPCAAVRQSGLARAESGSLLDDASLSVSGVKLLSAPQQNKRKRRRAEETAPKPQTKKRGVLAKWADRHLALDAGLEDQDEGTFTPPSLVGAPSPGANSLAGYDELVQPMVQPRKAFKAESRWLWSIWRIG